jgi:hypothetical protein
MPTRPILPAIALLAVLAGCNTAGLDSDTERGLAGAAIGAGTAAVVDGDVGTGAVIGGLGGVFCDDVGACR